MWCYKTEIKELPKEIGSLINLTHLYCNNTQIKELPKEIGSLINLEYLDCQNTEIKELPIEIINCRNLQNIIYDDCTNLVISPIIQRFLDGIINHNIYSDKHNVHTSSIQQSVKQ